ncbi:MAG: M56 family metallopeptidase, partial [Spirochaetota bacterium]
MPFRRNVSFYISSEVCSPIAFGILRPAVIVPAFMQKFSQCRIEHMIVHEVAHIRRFDFAATAGQRLLEAVFFFNPVVWYLSARMSDVREECCDDEVIKNGGDFRTYAECLLDVISYSSTGRTAANGMKSGDTNRRI